MTFKEVHPLRDDTATRDLRFDALKDPEGLPKPIGVEVNARVHESRNWSIDVMLEQEATGCVGFAIGHALGVRPAAAGLSDRFAVGLYREAREFDPWAADDARPGTSLLSACKAAAHRGLIEGYRGCYSVHDILRCLSSSGPVVCASDWTQTMMRPAQGGKIDVAGVASEPLGRYAYVIRGFEAGEFRIRTSLGHEWGRNADAFIRIDAFEELLFPGAEVIHLLGRTTDVHQHEGPVSPGSTRKRPPSPPDEIADDTERSLTLDATEREREPAEVK